MPGVPKITLRFHDLLKELTGSRKGVLPWLQFITAKWYRLNQQRKTVHKAESRRNLVQSSTWPPIELHRSCLIFPATMYDNTDECCQPGRLTWALVSRVFIGGQSGKHRAPTGLTLGTQFPALLFSHPGVKLIQLAKGPGQTKTGVTINHTVSINCRMWPKTQVY